MQYLRHGASMALLGLLVVIGAVKRLYLWLRRRLGFRGFVLLLAGAVFFLIGVGVAIMPGVRELDLFHTHLPRAVRTSIWCVSGTVAMIAAWFPAKIDHIKIERVAWGLIAIGPAERCLSFTWAIIWYGNWARLQPAAIWLFVSVILIVLSRWPESPLIVLERDEHAHAIDGRLDNGRA
jgi:hypothetical protein